MEIADFSENEKTQVSKSSLFTSFRFFGARRKSRKRGAALVDGGNILVLCLGNICRSPVVEYLLRKSLPPEIFQLRSRGLLSLDAQPSPPDYALQAKSLGVDLDHHVSTPLSDEDISWATVILIMDGINRAGLQKYGDEALQKIVWIGAWDPSGDMIIPDPFRQPPVVQRQIINRMKKATHHFSAWLLQRGRTTKRRKSLL